jgi:hypothetical protein
MYFFSSSNNNYVIQKSALSPEGMSANTRFSQEQCWQTLLFVLRENICKYLTQTIAGISPFELHEAGHPSPSRKTSDQLSISRVLEQEFWALVLCLEQMENNQKLRSEDLDAVSTM